MINNFIEAWDKNKNKLREYLRTHSQTEYSNYFDLVKILFDIIINPYLEEYESKFDTDKEKIQVIDDGDYQGTLIFILHRNTYQPDISEYIYTYVNYGSCSGCDTLLRIQSENFYRDDSYEYSTDLQINDYMTLFLHLLQHCNYFIGGYKIDHD